MILLNVRFDKSVVDALYFNKQYTAPDGSLRRQYYTDRRIYPDQPFDAPIFTFINCEPDDRTPYVLKVNVGPRLRISRVSRARGGLKKMQIIVRPDTQRRTPETTLYLARKGLPFTREEVERFRSMPWSYACRILAEPDKIVAYYYIPDFAGAKLRRGPP